MLEQFQKRLQEEIDKHPYEGNPQNLYDPLNYILGIGGKRIRPVLTLLAYGLYDQNYEKALPSAMAIEVFHNFSLIHDDIMDQAVLRRNQTTVHEKWDIPNAILSGDIMLVKAYEWLLKNDEKYFVPLLTLFNKTVTEVCEGQQMDMNFEKQEMVSESDYIEMIRLKTSVLLGCSLQFGAIVANADEEDCKILYQIGEQMGLGFQLLDDYLDAFGTEILVGKRIGGDILAGKKTIMYLHSSQSHKKRIEEIQNDTNVLETDRINMVKEIFTETGADVYLKNMALVYFQSAQNLLESLNIEITRKQVLKGLMDSLENRNY